MLVKYYFKLVILTCQIFLGSWARAQLKSEAAITIDNGLVQNEVTAVYQDAYGFLWFGTRGGLNKYDGYDFTVIRSDPSSGNNLTNQAVEVIVEDDHHTLWIGTKNGGLNSYSPIKENAITHYSPPDGVHIQEIKSLGVDHSGTLFIGSVHGVYTYKNGHFNTINNRITTNSLKVDAKGNVWVGTDAGLFLYEPTSNMLKKVDLGLNDLKVTSIAVNDQADTVYLGTWRAGLIRYLPAKGQTKQFLQPEKNIGDVGRNNAYRVFLDRNKTLWVGTWGGGLYQFNARSGNYIPVPIRPSEIYNTDYSIILSIIQDRTGILWIGTDGGGVCMLDPYKKKFGTITGGLINTHITSVYEDRNKGLWVGTRGGGLNYSKDKFNFIHQNAPAQSNVVRAFFEKDQRDLWVGTMQGLLIYPDFYHHPNASPFIVTHNIQDSNSISGPKVTAIAKDQSGLIWVGTQERGLNRVKGYQDGKPIFKRYSEQPGIKGALQNDRVSCLLVDHHNRVWVGSYDGLELYNRVEDNFDVFRNQPGLSTSISNNTILSLTEDHKGNIWVGTQQGLNKITISKNGQVSFKRYFETIGFPNDYIHALQIDHSDNVWMSTNKGISKLNTKTGSFQTFDKRDGVSSNTFSENSSFLSFRGEMFFGGITGLTYFYPDSIRLNHDQPRVVITSLKINNEEVNVGQEVEHKKILVRPLFLTDRIELSHRDYMVTLSFAALDFHASDKNQYRYRLEGFDRNWVNAGRTHRVTYTNLPSGTYTFAVEASNSDQIWAGQRASLQIKVWPPPWKTWWAYTIYGLIIGGLLLFSRQFTLSKVHLKNKLEKEHEITEMKSQFFSNISHEFRTPLTLIIGPLESVVDSPILDDKTKTELSRVKNQSKRLLSLVNQLLDFNKAENAVLQLNANEYDIVALLKNVYDSFADEAKRKSINYIFESSEASLHTLVDKDKIESIAYNLLSNAFKFTPAEGQICFHISLLYGSNECELKVTDSGKGVEEIYKDKVFDRFYQVSQAESGQYAGTGIGLAFVKELVELHQGKITITDNRPVGTVLTVVLPITRTPNIIPVNDALPETDHPILLVVEDNEELNDYIRTLLQPIGKVICASNGQEGIQKAYEIIPDLIISDVMMPIADGYELCQTLKADIRTSHVPIILLTAKSDDRSHIHGVGVGADNYLAKPFNPGVLLSHVNNLIQSRKKLKDLFAHRITLGPNEIEVTSSDEEFVNNAIHYLEDNLSKENLSIDELASQLNMSRSTFYRKLKAVTGMSGSDFIRLIRLKRSAQLLSTGEYSVSMAAYQAGFNDLKHFRKTFQAQFGLSPSAYQKKQQSGN